jgi:16S rRNA G966 N2-methylase RsmD
MLLNGLGSLMKAEIPDHERVVDLFCGAGSVSWFAATVGDRPVLSVDLQKYATTLAGAVTLRTSKADANRLVRAWLQDAQVLAVAHPLWRAAEEIDRIGHNTVTWCKRARWFCNALSEEVAGPMLLSYGGYYFCPTQAILFDSFLKCLPLGRERVICTAATIIAASQCSASPGHTAQPFQPTRTAAPFLREAWQRSPLTYAERALRLLCPAHARAKGETIVGDALTIAKTLNKADFVFVDPPYSAVQYSRFYHVLETVAQGGCARVSGAGRYPPRHQRPVSAFSRIGEARGALGDLLEALAAARCTVAFTFPLEVCSNGLSGAEIAETAAKWFAVRDIRIQSRLSTLGGNNEIRRSRSHSRELILLLRPIRRIGRIAKRFLDHSGAARKATVAPERARSGTPDASAERGTSHEFA